MSDIKKNAIEQRLDHIETLWNAFADKPDARLCRWLVSVDERRMIDVFLEVQNDESGSVPDLFIRFEEPFVDPAKYGLTLAESLQAKYDEIRDSLREDGMASDWRRPAANSSDADTVAFAKALGSLQSHYQSLLSQVVAVLMPERTSKTADWQAWLQRLIRSLPSGVRVMVVDDLLFPKLGELAKAEPAAVETIEPKLDMPAAYLELARGVGKGGPGVSFRMNFVALAQAAGAGDIAKAKQMATAALAIAQQQGWPQMEAVIQMTLASALLGAKKSAEAIACYRSASATMAAQPNDPTAPKIILQSKLSEGAALVSDSKHPEAAKVYEESAALAEQSKDFLMGMEAWRMASYCHEVSNQIEASWRCGNKALDAAAKMDADLRVSSTLPFVGQAMLRIAKGADEEYAGQVRTRMSQLAGPDWEKKLEATLKAV